MVRRQSPAIFDAGGLAIPALISVKSAKGGFDVVEQTGHVGVRTRQPSSPSFGMSGAVVGEEFVGDIADMDARHALSRSAVARQYPMRRP